MDGARLPSTVRLPASLVANDDGGVSSEVVGPSSKFGITWPAESPQPVPTVMNQARTERAAGLSSSDGDSDLSDAEPSDSPSGRYLPARHYGEEGDMMVQPGRRSSRQSFVIDEVDESPNIPRLSRTISMPLPAQLEHLQNPRRMSSASTYVPSTPSDEVACNVPLDHEALSLELADSVQMVVQTLLQVSPAQVLDPAKEQFSACSLSVPTTCMSAVFTAMKHLNYLSANMSMFCGVPRPNLVPDHATSTPASPLLSVSFTDFDIGEMLQNVGDVLSGAVAEAGIDMVLFHGDVGMKHVAVRGDECGISFALSHLARQIIATAKRGDSIEIGLLIATPPADPAVDPIVNAENATLISDETISPPVLDVEGPLQCTFKINHKFSVDGSRDDGTPNATARTAFERERPVFDSPLQQRLLQQVGATLTTDLPTASYIGKACAITVKLERGSPSVINARRAPVSQDVSYLINDVQIATEPSLAELASFAETLRGKKVTLYASIRSSFAHHLTSYLTAWGLDVSHISSEIPETDITLPGDAPLENMENQPSSGAPTRPKYGTHLDGFTQRDQPPSALSANQQGRSTTGLSFVFIDDDVAVLREQLRTFRATQPYNLYLNLRKRPTLANRPRSSPHVPRAMGQAQGTHVPSQVVVVHFTSLSNFKIVKDIIQSDLAAHAGIPATAPEVMIIPKPAGPRRFLTALHTAVTKPIVDPFFSPIATSPVSPGVPASPFYNAAVQSPGLKSPSTRPPGQPRSNSNNSDQSLRSSRDPLSGEHITLAPPSPLGMTDSKEYFPEGSVKLGTSPSSGLVIQSPDGQPAGIFFHPRGRNTKSDVASSPGGVAMERDRGQLALPHRQSTRATASRKPSDDGRQSPQGNLSFYALLDNKNPAHHSSVADQQMQNVSSPSSPILKGKSSKPSSPTKEEDTSGRTPFSAPVSSRKPSFLDRRRTPEQSPLNETSPSSLSRRPTRRGLAEKQPSTPITGKGKAPTDANIVPPISVLIVDDNPINQTILSTFMRKKKIKYDVAHNGEEAVQKWRSGGFHLVLMDIQMPVMNGIQATREIRRLETLNAYSGHAPGTPLSEQSSRTPSEAPSTETRVSTSPYRSAVIIVALTASSLQSDRVAALAAGCNDFLTKPVSLQWLNNKIIEWGSIKALQMWAEMKPEVARTISTEQSVHAQHVAQRLHVPEGRKTPTDSPSRSSSKPRSNMSAEATPSGLSTQESPERVLSSQLENSSDSSPPTDSSNISEPLLFAKLPAPEILTAPAALSEDRTSSASEFHSITPQNVANLPENTDKIFPLSVPSTSETSIHSRKANPVPPTENK